MIGSMIGWVVLASCDRTDSEQTPPPACATELTWQNSAGPLVIQWCQPCHSVGVPPEGRQGAPESLNFDTAAEVLAFADRVAIRATGADADMPPGGGPTAEDRADLAEWLACGAATGTTGTPVDHPCAPRVEVLGDARASTWDCAAGNVVVGDLRADAATDCICAVTGTVTAEAPILDLPELASIGGDLVIGGPAVEVSLPWLVSVDGSVLVEHNPGLTLLTIPRLATVGQAVVVDDNDALLSIRSLVSLVSAQDFVIRGNALLGSVDGVARVESLRSLAIVDNPSLATVRSFLFVTAMDGEVLVEGNPNLAAIDVVPDLVRAGSLRVRNNDALAQIASFAFLAELDGDLEVSGQATLRQLGNVLGDDGPFHLLTHVGGSVIVADNADLVTTEALLALDAVDGDVTVTDNPDLPAADVAALLAAIDAIGGTVTVSGNGP